MHKGTFFKISIFVLTAVFPLALMASDGKATTVDQPVSIQNAYLVADNAAPAPATVTTSPASPAATAPAAAAPAPADQVAPPSTEDISAFLSAIGGAKGAGTMAIIALIVQGLLLMFRSTIGKFAGIYQLLIVNGLTLLAGVIGLKMTGMDWGSALLHSQTLATFQVFAHQVWKQFGKLPADTAAPKPA
jgi:hypothetical protein